MKRKSPFFLWYPKNLNAGPSSMEEISREANCMECKLFARCKSPKMKASGEGKRKVLIVGEAPGETEDLQGIQFVGEAGKLLRRTLAALKFDLDRDARKINAVNCRPPNNRTPTKNEIQCCRPMLVAEIKESRPKVIVPMGETALTSVLWQRWRQASGGISRWNGFQIPDQEYGCWIVPTFHPSFILRMQGKNGTEAIWIRDLKRAIAKSEEPDFPSYSKNNLESSLITLKDETKIIKALKMILHKKPALIAIDFETTGLKPRKDGHRIVACSICSAGIENEDEKEVSISFLLNMRKDSGNEKIRRLLCKIFTDPLIGKISHNSQFELTWAKEILGCWIAPIIWDSEIAAHIIDNRQKTCSLKFQAYVNFGIVYEDLVPPTLRDYLFSGEDGTSFNRINEIPTDELLKYNALDSLFCFKLAKKQMEELGFLAHKTEERIVLKRFPKIDSETEQVASGLQKAMMLFLDGSISFATMTAAGIKIDINQCKRELRSTEEKIEKCESNLRNSVLGMEWKRKYGQKMNFESPIQLSRLLSANVSSMNGEKISTRHEDLEELVGKIDGIANLLEYRRLRKQQNYLLGLEKEIENGKLHPFFSLSGVSTYRSSSHNINFQNIPIRHGQMSEAIRKCFVPRNGRKLIEVDYKGIEVSVAACYHKDPNMISYLSSMSKDLHKDMASMIYLLKRSQVSKQARYSAKNAFVFPQFYGDYYVNCAKALWKNVQALDLKIEGAGISIAEHLRNSGLGTYEKFEEHLMKVENKFWNVMFPKYREWKEEWVNMFEKKGYVEMLTGFRCWGPMTRNQAINYPIQGTAFHILLWSLIRITDKLKEKRMRAKLIGQIHDCMLFDVPEDEVEELIKLLNEVMTVEVRDEWKWIIVPLSIEVEATPINQSWAAKRPIEENH